MKLKHICSVFFLWIAASFTNNCISQDLVKIRDIGLILVVDQNDFSKLTENHEKLKKYEFETLEESSKDVYDWGSTVYHLYITKDSSTYYFNRMLKRSPRRVCRLILSAEENHKVFMDSKKVTPESNWFLYDLPDVNPNEILQYCQNYIDSIYGPPKPPKKEILSETVKAIMSQDQKYRGNDEVDWTLQNRLDSLNRVKLDSLYNIDNSLKNFTPDEIYVFSFVLHHSNDCNWVYKWTHRFIELYNNRYTGNSILGPALKRMFDEKEGYCTKQDPQKRNYYIYMLKNKYPIFFENRKID